jgi:putative membrane protein
VTAWLPAAPLALLASAYALAVTRLGRRGDHWPPWRAVAAAGGVGALCVALLPPVAAHDEDPRVHVAQHLLLAMVGPGLLALAAPVTLALRTVRTPTRRRLLAVLASPPARVATHPLVVLALDVGGMYAYYLTGLLEAIEEQPWLHALVHAHMIAAGCLFAWLVVGLDPIPRRPGTAVRIALVVVAGAAHDVLAKLLFVHGWGRAAQLLFYGSELADVLLGVVVLAQWYTRGSRELARAARREAATRPAERTGENPGHRGSGRPTVRSWRSGARDRAPQPCLQPAVHDVQADETLPGGVEGLR